jgi:hypothetical protein
LAKSGGGGSETLFDVLSHFTSLFFWPLSSPKNRYRFKSFYLPNWKTLDKGRREISGLKMGLLKINKNSTCKPFSIGMNKEE